LYIYRNIDDDNVLSIEMKFIKLNKDVVGYENGISIEIAAYTMDYSFNEYTLCRFSYPQIISEGKVLWKHPESITKDHNINIEDLKKFCEKIVKLKVFE
jgi:hypothetical protein